MDEIRLSDVNLNLLVALEALEGAGKQDPLAATQLAMKLKPTLEVLLGPGAL